MPFEREDECPASHAAIAEKHSVARLLMAWLQPGLEGQEKEKEPGEGRLSEIVSEHQVLGRENVFGAL